MGAVIFGTIPCRNALKAALRRIALERMQILIECAVSNARADPQLAQRQAAMARRISTRYRVRMPYQLRMVYCKKCKMFMAPGVGCRFRLGRSHVKSIRITCSFCCHTYRKIIRG